MKLRSGLTYSSLHAEINSLSNTVKTKTKVCSKKNPMKKTKTKQKTAISSTNKSIIPVIDIDKHIKCSICQQQIQKGDIICSCNINNINNHCFHKECMKLWIDSIKGGWSNLFCPYCTKALPMRFKFVKIEY